MRRLVMLIHTKTIEKGFTKILRKNYIPIFVTTKIEIYLFSKQLLKRYDLDGNKLTAQDATTSCSLFYVEKTKVI